MLVAQGVAREVTHDPLGPLVAQTMEKAMDKLSEGIGTAVDAALKQFAQAQARSRKNAVPAIFGEGGTGDPKRTFGAFLLAVRTGDQKALEEMGSRWVEWESASQKTAMSTQTGT